MAFGKKHFVSSAEASTFKHRIGAWYRVKMTKAPFLFFGLPFMATMVAGSFFLTPATAIRYEKHDRKVRRVWDWQDWHWGLVLTEADVSRGSYGLEGEPEKGRPERRILCA